MLVNVTRCGLAYLITKDSVPPLGSSEAADIGLRYGFPSEVWPLLLASVTVLGSPLRAAAIGAGTGKLEMFLSVMVWSKVLVVRFKTSPERVIANWLVMSWVPACAAVTNITLSTTTTHQLWHDTSNGALA